MLSRPGFPIQLGIALPHAFHIIDAYGACHPLEGSKAETPEPHPMSSSVLPVWAAY
jgi:hypothetical protein